MEKNNSYPGDPKLTLLVEEGQVKITFRQQIEKFLNSYYGKRITYLSLFLSFFSCIIYVVMTYIREDLDLEGADLLYPPQLSWFLYVDIAILVYYMLEYILEFLSKQHKLGYLFSVKSFVEVVTIIPIFCTGTSNVDLIMVVQIMRIFRFLRLVQFVFDLNKFGTTEVSQQITKILLTLLALILFMAGVLEAVENTTRIDNKTTIHEMIYFVVVTLATVGYGDVVPESELGRVCVMLLILFTIVLIPMQTNDLIRLMSLQSSYARAIYKANSEVPHLLVTGYVNVAALRDFSVELFHPDHGSQDKNAVVLQQKDPGIEMISFLHHAQYELSLTYLRGNPMSERDLKRSAATLAKACVILTKKYSNDSHITDHKNILTGLAIKKYVHQITNGKNMRLIMQLIKPESKTHYYSSLNRKSNDQLIIIEEIKMNLLAKSCFSPGIISMLSNLITSAGDIDVSSEDKDWVKEYTVGMGYEIYRTDLSHKFQGKKFSEVAAIVYNEFQGILFGLELDVSGQTIIRLNPGNYTIPHTMENKIRVYMICEDKKVADQVALYEMTPDEIAAYQQQKNNNSMKNKKKMEFSEEQDIDMDDEMSVQRDSNDANQEDNELLESDYTLLPDPLNLMQVTRISIQDHSDITNHIVVCGVHPSIYYFLLPLRASYLIELQYVVILAPEPPGNEVWEGLNRFPKVIYIKGSPLIEEDLQRANINFAEKAVILSRDMVGVKTSRADGEDDMIDAESIFIYKAIKRCNKNVQIMIELMHSTNSEFLLPKKVKRNHHASDFDFRHELTPLFAAGEIYISSIIDTLTSQAFYNPHIVTILQQILSGGKQSNNVIRTICELAELKQSNLWQISVPEDYLNKTFGELFTYLTVERELVALGLYRLPGATDNLNPYVYTNPDPLTKLTHRDKVFVLAANMPSDLINGTIPNKAPESGEIGTNSNINMKIASNINLSYDRDDIKIDPKRKDLTTRFKLEVPQVLNRNTDNSKGNKLDLDNLNQNSVTAFVFEQINHELGHMQQELTRIKQNITTQNDQILEKVKSALRQEFSTLGHYS